MKIYVDKKPETCGVCTLVNASVLDVMENREMVLQHICPILDLSVNPDNLDANCPIIELKPKELEWKESASLNNGVMTTFYYAKTPIGDYRFYVNTEEICIYDTPTSPESIHPKTLEEAKEICKNDFNKLFCEMIGGK